jgi:hypothetical protein
MITKPISVEEKLVAQVISRVVELRTDLKNCTVQKEKASIQTAIANNVGWLLSLGVPLNIPELEGA